MNNAVNNALQLQELQLTLFSCILSKAIWAGVLLSMYAFLLFTSSSFWLVTTCSKRCLFCLSFFFFLTKYMLSPVRWSVAIQANHHHQRSGKQESEGNLMQIRIDPWIPKWWPSITWPYACVFLHLNIRCIVYNNTVVEVCNIFLVFLWMKYVWHCLYCAFFK